MFYASQLMVLGTPSGSSEEASSEQSTSTKSSEESMETEDDGVKGGTRRRRLFLDNEELDVRDEQAQAEDDALSWENYGSGYDTNEST